MKTFRHLLASALIASSCVGHAAEKPSAKSLAAPDGKLDRDRAVLYIILRDSIPLTKLLESAEPKFLFGKDVTQPTPATRVSFDPDKLALAVDEKLDDLRSKTGHVSPWTAEELDAAFPPKEPKNETPAWKEIEGLTKAGVIKTEQGKWTIGPIQLRKNSDELGKNLDDAKGLTLGFADNRLVKKPGLWNSEGVAALPWQLGGNLETGIAAEWNLAQNHEPAKHDVEEATYSVPIKLRYPLRTPYSALWDVQAKAYYQTDFSGGHQIQGAEFAGEFVGRPWGGPLYVGGFQNFTDSSVQYQLRLVPKLNYSKVRKEGRHSTRKLGDHWLRLGALVSLDFRLGGNTTNPFDVGVSHEFADDVRAKGGHGNRWKANATWWANANVGLTLEYAVGDTPVADEKIDLLKLGFEFKF